MKKIIVFCIFSFSLLPVFGQFKKASFMIDGYTLPYQIMYPDNYDKTKQYPLLVFLHGAGERGNDNEKQLVNGKQFLIDNFHSKYPAIVIVPQCPADNYWANIIRHQLPDGMEIVFGKSDQPTQPMITLMALIENWLSSGNIDLSRVYVGGLSMGGMGTFELLWRMPKTFAAAFPICGGGDLNKLPLFAKNTAVWIFHGEVDSVVPVENSRQAYERLKKLGCIVKYTEYKGVNHNSWDNAFKEPDLPGWLFSEKNKIALKQQKKHQ